MVAIIMLHISDYMAGMLQKIPHVRIQYLKNFWNIYTLQTRSFRVSWNVREAS